MKKFIYLLAIALVMTTMSCNKAPADDSADPAPAPKSVIYLARYIFATGEPISIINKSTNFTTSAWDFGDGTKSTLTNPSKTYSKAGNYTIKLTVKNADGTQAISSIPIIVGTRTFIKMVVSSWPSSDTTGKAWRTDFSGPDVTVKLVEVSTSTTLEDWSASALKVTNSSTVATFTGTGTSVLGNTLYRLDFYDNPASGQVLMSQIYFNGKDKSTTTASPFLITKVAPNKSGGSSGTYKIAMYYNLN